jgi:hypothetical protein
MKIVKVIWNDAMALMGGWQEAADYVSDGEHMLCATVGYLIHQDSERLILAMAHDFDNGHVNHCYVIPQVCIMKIITLSDSDEGEEELS